VNLIDVAAELGGFAVMSSDFSDYPGAVITSGMYSAILWQMLLSDG
jgi:hypothetical protein